MTISETIARIDDLFEPDPSAIINVTGTTISGNKVDLWVDNDGSGPLVWPGASFLPYGGIVYVPLLNKIELD